MTREELNAKTVAELRTLARERKIAPGTQIVRMTKVELVDKLSGALPGPTPTMPHPDFTVTPTASSYGTDETEQITALVARIKEIPGVKAEICGNWVWASGDTKPARSQLKALGMAWGKKKSKWYWHPPGYKKRGKKQYSMNQIRHMHGSKPIREEE